MGRSGTTWVSALLNYKKQFRILFEPFFPAQVKAARGFHYIHYIPPHENTPELAKKAQSILSGRPQNGWIDRENKSLYYRHRIVKDIRCNLMAGWLHTIAPTLPLLLLIRHPLQVASSWRKLGWGIESGGNRSDFEIITSQKALFSDFPILAGILKEIDAHSFLDTFLFQWGVFHMVPFEHLRNKNAYFLFYENLLCNPQTELKKLFAYVGLPYEWQEIVQAFNKDSSTNFLQRDIAKDKNQLLHSWRNEFTSEEITRANQILEMFGLANLYDAAGIPTSDKAAWQR